ncbi:MAG: RluA family pseudouridine synthase [Mycoplasma sp.]
MTEIIININDIDKRLDNFLLKYFPDWNKPLIYKYLRTNKIKVNGKKADFNYRLRRWDKVVVYVNTEERISNNDLWFTRFNKPLEIIFEDENILIINKPIGLISQSNDTISDSVQARFLAYLYETKQYDPKTENSFIPSICHRLDRNTNGLLVCAKNAVALAEMNRIIKEHEIIKKYRCLVFGKMPKSSDRLIAYHYKNSNNNLVYINNEEKPNYKEIITEYKVISFDGKYSLLDINLITGRTHQIRAHMNYIGHSLIGEKKYRSNDGDEDTRFKYQALVCNGLAFKISPDSPLAYLNNKTFKISDIWFELILKKNK